jgi:hypothetical protein
MIEKSRFYVVFCVVWVDEYCYFCFSTRSQAFEGQLQHPVKA